MRMPNRCVAAGCSNFPSDLVTLFRFPKVDANLRLSRTRQVQRTRPGWVPSNSSVLCSDHFDVECFEAAPALKRRFGFTVKRRKILKPHAVPTIFGKQRPRSDGQDHVPPPPGRDAGEVSVPTSSLVLPVPKVARKIPGKKKSMKSDASRMAANVSCMFYCCPNCKGVFSSNSTSADLRTECEGCAQDIVPNTFVFDAQMLRIPVSSITILGPGSVSEAGRCGMKESPEDSHGNNQKDDDSEIDDTEKELSSSPSAASADTSGSCYTRASSNHGNQEDVHHDTSATSIQSHSNSNENNKSNTNSSYIMYIKPEKRYVCQFCDYICTKMSQLIIHARKHQKPMVFVCKRCETGFSSFLSLQHHECEKLHCTVKGCAFATIYRSVMQRHVNTRHKWHNLQHAQSCDFCNFKSISPKLMQEHEWKYDHGSQYTCPKCTFKSCSKKVLSRHKMEHSHRKKHYYQCDECDYITGSKDSMISHAMGHMDIKVCHCSVCDYGCYNRQGVHNHIRKNSKCRNATVSTLSTTEYVDPDKYLVSETDTHADAGNSSACEQMLNVEQVVEDSENIYYIYPKEESEDDISIISEDSDVDIMALEPSGTSAKSSLEFHNYTQIETTSENVDVVVD